MSNLHKILSVFAAFIIAVSGVFFSGCIIVKEESGETETQVITLSPKPEIPMSEDIARSDRGDMIAFLPQDWFFPDLDGETSTEVFAQAVNPNYTLCAVFSKIRKNGEAEEIFRKEGLIGLARLNLARKIKKTGGGVKQIGKYATIEIGSYEFAQYETTNGALLARSAVFVSNFGGYYEFTLMQMNITGAKIPAKEEFDKIFRSILSTIEY